MPDQKISADPINTSPSSQAYVAGIDPGVDSTKNYRYDRAALLKMIGAVNQPRIATHRTQLAGNPLFTAGTYTRNEGRITKRTGGQALRDFRFAWANVYHPGGGSGETAGPNDITIEAAVELLSPAIAIRLTFDGQNTALISPGGVVWSDPIGIDLPANTDFFLRQGLTVSAPGLQWPIGDGAIKTGEVYFTSASASSQVLATGTMSNPSGGTGGAGGFPCFACVGVPVAPMAAVQFWCDSIGAGSGDVLDTVNGNYGFIARGLWNGGNVIPWVKHGVGGGGILQDSTFLLSHRRRVVSQYANNFIIELGNNDFNTGGATLASYQTAMTNHVTSLRRRGPCKIFACCITTRTSTTDAWATTANQTVINNFQVGGLVDQANAWMAAQVGGLFDGFIDVRPSIQDVNNKWVVNGTANYPTADGAHPSGAMHALMAPYVTAIIPNLYVS